MFRPGVFCGSPKLRPFLRRNGKTSSTGCSHWRNRLCRGQDLDADLFAAHVPARPQTSTMPLLRGAFLGVLTEMRRMKPEALAAELAAYARGGMEQQVVAGDFLQGVLRSPEPRSCWGRIPSSPRSMSCLRAAGGDTFLNMVPRLRAAFETLHERQRDSLALHVAELYGLKEGESCGP